MHQQPEKASGSCCAGGVGQKDPLLWVWCGSSLLLWILQQHPIFTVLPDLCSAPVGFSFLGSWEVTDPSVPPRYLSLACQPFPEATKACNNFSLTKTLVKGDPKSQNCIGNADLINKLFPQEHCMDGINKTLSHRQIDIPACQLCSFPCCWWGAQCCFFQIQGNADCKSWEMLEGEAMAREPFAIAGVSSSGANNPCPARDLPLSWQHLASWTWLPGTSTHCSAVWLGSSTQSEQKSMTSLKSVDFLFFSSSTFRHRTRIPCEWGEGTSQDNGQGHLGVDGEIFRQSDDGPDYLWIPTCY